jgi:hypothetical protein
MRVLSCRRLAVALALAPLLVACGVLIDVAEDPPITPDRVDGSPDEGGAKDGSGETDAAASDAGAAADACATAAVCSPERLATLSGGVVRLVVVGSSLYAAEMTSPGPRVVSLASGGPGPVLELDPHANGPDIFRADSNIAVDSSGAVYWGTPNGLRRHEPGAGADPSTDAGVTELSALGAPVSGVRIADGRLHFTVNGPQGVPMPNIGHIASCALPGCSDVQSSTFTAYALDVIAIGASRWWLGTDNAGANLALRKTGAVLSGEQLLPSRMVTDGLHIFWSTIDGLRMYTLTTDAVTDLLPAATAAGTRVSGVAVDPAGTLFVTQQSSVLRCTIVAGQCSFTTVATTAGNAVDIAVDATHVYWGTTDGSVWRLRKP